MIIFMLQIVYVAKLTMSFYLSDLFLCFDVDDMILTS